MSEPTQLFTVIKKKPHCDMLPVILAFTNSNHEQKKIINKKRF